MTLAALTAAAQARRTADEQYRSAVLAYAHKHGATATATALGVSRQAVAQLVKRAQTDETAAAERLTELDRRYSALVDRYAASYTLSSAKAITALELWAAAVRKQYP